MAYVVRTVTEMMVIGRSKFEVWENPEDIKAMVRESGRDFDLDFIPLTLYREGEPRPAEPNISVAPGTILTMTTQRVITDGNDDSTLVPGIDESEVEAVVSYFCLRGWKSTRVREIRDKRFEVATMDAAVDDQVMANSPFVWRKGRIVHAVVGFKDGYYVDSSGDICVGTAPTAS